MASAGTVTVDFAAETAKFTAELKKVRDQLGRMESNLQAVDKVARVAFRFFTAGALLSFAKSAFAAADATGDAAERAGIAVESFSRLQFAASQTDVEMSALTSGLQQFQVTLSKASTGSKEAQTVLARFGVTAESLAKLRIEQQIAAVANAFQGVTDPADRTRLAVELFGKSAGPQLVPLLGQGEEGIRRFFEQADRLGITLRGSTALAIDEVDKAIKRVTATAQSAVSGAFGLLALQLSPPETQEGRLAVSIARLDAEIRLLQKDIDDGPETGILDRLLGTHQESDVENLKRAKEQLAALREQLRGIRGETAASQLNNLLPLPFVGLQEIDISAIQSLKINVDELGLAFQRLNQSIAEIQQARVSEALALTNEAVLQSQREIEQLVTSEFQAELDKRSAAAQRARDSELQQESILQQSLQNLRSGTVNAAIGALQSFAGQSKKAAIALVLINKARAIASVIQDTAAAATKAIAVYGPTPAGFAAAGAAKAFGAVQIALIAASGFGESQQINRSGGAPIGSPSNPVFTSNQSLDGSQPGATPRTSVQVIVQGNVVGNQQFIDQLIDEISEAVEDKDVILIKQTSRNAQELLG